MSFPDLLFGRQNEYFIANTSAYDQKEKTETHVQDNQNNKTLLSGRQTTCFYTVLFVFFMLKNNTSVRMQSML